MCVREWCSVYGITHLYDQFDLGNIKFTGAIRRLLLRLCLNIGG